MNRIRWRSLHVPMLVLATAIVAPAAIAVKTSAADRSDDTPTLSVVTLNLWHDKGDWPKRKKQILAALRALHPDVISLQEVIQHEKLPNQAQTIADALGYEVFFVSTDQVGKPLRYGNALLMRHPVLARDSTLLQPLDDYRTAAHVRIEVGGRAVDVYVTHLHYTDQGGAIRARQLQDLRAFVARTNDGAPVLIAGDFNAQVTQPELEPMTVGYIDSYADAHPDAATHLRTTLNPAYYPPAEQARIDHVFAQRGRFEVKSARIILDRADTDGVWPSDHFGMQVSLRLTPPDRTIDPWRDPSRSPDARAAALIARMDENEKFRLLRADFGDASDKGPKPAGAIGSAGYVPANIRLGIPALQETDAGLGVTRDGLSGKGATSLPAMLAIAASWDPDIAHAAGAMIGEESWRKGFNVLLAGSVNLQRDPRSGRNFEYAGEDPLLAGTIAGNAIRGVQSRYVVSTMKHFALNDLETARNTHDARIDERAMRESDLLAFQLAHEIGRPGSVMCAYNRINGTHACEHDWLLNTVLKRDWGFRGWVMSDWGGVHSAAKAAMAGLDQQSAGDVFDKQVYFDRPLRTAVARGDIAQARIDDMARRVLRGMITQGLFEHPPQPTAIDFDADRAVSQHAAEAGAVLLRNERALLPLSPQGGSIVVIGGHADAGVAAGGGSSAVQPPEGNAVPGLMPNDWPGPPLYQPSSPLRAIVARAGADNVRYFNGNDGAATVDAARTAATVVVFATQWAGEAFDNATMRLPDDQDALIAAVSAANPRTVVVLETNGPVEMPWLDGAGSVLQAWYPGSGGGEAIARLLFGEVDPGGRLPFTWPRDSSQLPRPWIEGSGFRSRAPPLERADYRIEGANVGYKWFAALKLAPLFPFGHGLTYTAFAHEKFAVEANGRRVRAYLDVVNTGARAGVDVVQLYLDAPSAATAPMRLIGWQKIALKAGERRRVGIEVDPRLLAEFDARSGGWRIRGGRYRLRAAGSAIDPGVRAEIELQAESLSNRPITPRPSPAVPR